MSRLSIDYLISLWQLVETKGACSISTNSDQLEFHFESAGLEKIVDTLNKEALLKNKGSKFFSITRKNESNNIYFFKDTKSMFAILKAEPTLINKFDFFVFDYDGHYLYYDYLSKEIFTNSTFSFTKYLFDHYLSYSRLLEVFKSNVPLLVEIDKLSMHDNELIVISKGTEKFITSIHYSELDESIFNRVFSRIPIEEFKLKLISDEWVASFKNVLCQFMELQSDIHRTFATLYQNFTYVLNQAEKDYQLFISNFSFEKIRKQFKAEKSTYFDTLSVVQDKISSQIVSIPLSLGASIFSFYQLSVNARILELVYMAILIYSVFIIYVISIYLLDVRKLAKDVNEEESNLKQHFPSQFDDFKQDFDYMRSKRRNIRVLGYSIIIALILTLVAITYYMAVYKSDQSNFKFKFL